MTIGALRIDANGLEHRVLEWGAPQGTPVLLIHGYMDAAATWDRVASTLAARGFRVLAPDMRGFGDGARAPRGSYYHFADYVADVAGLVDALYPDRPISLAGHSMGGTVATLFAGAFPERVARCANLEGLGPPDSGPDAGPTRMRRWIEDLRNLRVPGPMPLSELRRRLEAFHPNVAADAIEELLPALVTEIDGGFVWRVDPLHRTTSPSTFSASVFRDFIKRVACPVLYVSGGTTGYHVPDEEQRLACFAKLERATLEDAGHMMHWTRARELALLLARFFT